MIIASHVLLALFKDKQPKKFGVFRERAALSGFGSRQMVDGAHDSGGAGSWGLDPRSPFSLQSGSRVWRRRRRFFFRRQALQTDNRLRQPKDTHRQLLRLRALSHSPIKRWEMFLSFYYWKNLVYYFDSKVARFAERHGAGSNFRSGAIFGPVSQRFDS